MTITNTTRSVTYTGNGTTTNWSYIFPIPDDSSHSVTLVEIATGAETVVSTSDYTISGLGESGGGTVIYPLSGSPLANTHTITITRSVPRTQTVTITNQTRYFADTVMKVWDRLTMMIQELGSDNDRALKTPIDDGSIGDIPRTAERKSKFLAFDASGEPIASATAAGTAPVTAFMETVLDDEDAPTARATLGALADIAEDTTPQLGGPLDANGNQIGWEKGADLASAATVTIGNDGNYFHITGTTTIAGFSTPAFDTVIKVYFTAALTLTNSASFALVGGADITVSTGDTATFVGDTSGNWRMTSWAAARSQTTWETGTDTTPALASPAVVKAAIDKLNPMSARALTLEETQPSGTGGTSSVAGTWVTRPITAIPINQIGASLASNQLTLLAGTYLIDIKGHCYRTTGNIIRIRDITNSADLVYSMTSHASNAYNGGMAVIAHDIFTIAGTTVLEIQHFANVSVTSGFGNPINAGIPEKYLTGLIWQIG